MKGNRQTDTDRQTYFYGGYTYNKLVCDFCCDETEGNYIDDRIILEDKFLRLDDDEDAWDENGQQRDDRRNHARALVRGKNTGTIKFKALKFASFRSYPSSGKSAKKTKDN